MGMNRRVLARPAALTGTVILVSVLLLSACSAAGTSSGASASSAQVRAGLGHASSAGSAALPATPPRAGLSATQTAQLAAASQSIIYTAGLTIRAKNVAATAQRAVAIVVAAGGYTASEHLTSGGHGSRGPAVSLTLKVPVPVYQEVLARLSSPALGTQLAMQQRATDVTQQVADVSSLVTSQRDAIAALQGLLRRAGSVSGLLDVQQQISSDEATLNSLLAQQRALDHETSYATVTIALVSPRRAIPLPPPARHGFLAGLASGWRAFTHAAVWTLTAVGAALPFVVFILMLAAGGLAGWRYVQRRKARATPAA